MFPISSGTVLKKPRAYELPGRHARLRAMPSAAEIIQNFVTGLSLIKIRETANFAKNAYYQHLILQIFATPSHFSFCVGK